MLASQLMKFWPSRLTPLYVQAAGMKHNFKPYPNGPEDAWRKARGRKFIRIELPNFNAIRNDKKLTPEEIRSRMKEKGVVPPRVYSEKTINIISTNMIVEPYVPPEGDGKMSLLTKEGGKQRLVRVEKKSKSLWAIRRLRSFEEEWIPQEFAKTAFEVYLRAHQALADKDEDTLHQTVTEWCYPQMTFRTENSTIRWKYIDTIEQPRVCHVRVQEVISKGNEFAQITCRFHTRQTLALYDRFGYLMYGSEVIVKDVLEYVVFEKHLSSSYGCWRIHAKIIPDWMPARDPVVKTFRKPPPPPPLTEKEIKEKEELKKQQETEEEVDEKIQQPTPAVA